MNRKQGAATDGADAKIGGIGRMPPKWPRIAVVLMQSPKRTLGFVGLRLFSQPVGRARLMRRL